MFPCHNHPSLSESLSLASSFAPLRGRGCLPLLVGPANEEDLGLSLLKILLDSSKHVHQLQERGMNIVYIKVNNKMRKGV